MAMNLESLLHNLITSGVKFSDPDTILKIKILNISQLIFIILAPLLGLFYFFIGAIPLFYVTTIAGLSMIPGILILRKSRNTVLVGNYAIFIIWTTLSILSRAFSLASPKRKADIIFGHVAWYDNRLNMISKPAR